MNTGLTVYIAGAILALDDETFTARNAESWSEWLTYQLKKNEKVIQTEIIKGKKGRTLKIGGLFSEADVPDRVITKGVTEYGNINPEPQVIINEQALYSENVRDSLNLLVTIGAASVIEDTIADNYYRLIRSPNLDSHNDRNTSLTVEIVSKYNDLGIGWLKNSINKLYTDPERFHSNIEMGIPASNRIVSISDNLPDHKQAISKLEKIIKETKASNEFAKDYKEERDANISSLELSKNFLDSGIYYTKAIWELLLKPLKFIAQKFPDEMIKALASELIKALMEILNKL